MKVPNTNGEVDIARIEATRTAGGSIAALDEMELPITQHMVLIRNEDVPGMIGRVGTLLGDLDINIRDMVVGRHPDGGAMMGLCVDRPLPERGMRQILDIEGVSAARYIHLA